MTLFRNKYRVESARHPHHDYAAPGYYFVTICTRDRVHWFGRIVDGVMELNEPGNIALREWLRTGELRAHVRLDEYVVMPNHFHGVVEILDLGDGRDALQCVSTNVVKFGPQRANLASIIRGFKSAVVRAIRKLNPEFAWQARFHDRIVRDNDELARIRAYIENNPANWRQDDYFNAAVETPRRGVSTQMNKNR